MSATARELFWIPIAGPGRLATLTGPPSGAALEARLSCLREAGLDRLVSLLEGDASEERESCLRAGLAFDHFPIEDFGLPRDEPGFWALAERLRLRLEAGEGVGIHCRAGIGRSSLLAGAVLVRLGQRADEVFVAISAARGLTVPDGPVQRDWFLASARTLASRS